MFSWFRPKASYTPEQPKLTLRERGIRNNIFFRLNSGPLLDAEVFTENEDVPKGAPILQHLCYELRFPWCAHAITISVWDRSLTAQIARNKDSIYDLYFTGYDDGWLLSIDPPEGADETETTEIISAIHGHVTHLAQARDLRWFHDDVLTCGVFHKQDFDLGTVTPFDEPK